MLIHKLSIGNIVTIAVLLYKPHLSRFLTFSLLMGSWFAIPIYGWAQYYTYSGFISRWAFNELIHNNEDNRNMFKSVTLRQWRLLKIGFILEIIPYLLMIVFINLVKEQLLKFVSISLIPFPFEYFVYRILIDFLFLIYLCSLYTRWILAEVIQVVEEDVTVGQSFNRSWELTKKSVLQIQGVIVLTLIITLPLQCFWDILCDSILNYLKNVDLLLIIYNTIFFNLTISKLTLTIPIWQILKSILYYDLRNRYEGLDLELPSAVASSASAERKFTRRL